MMSFQKKTSLTYANSLLRIRDYKNSIEQYEKIIRNASSPIRKYVRFNLEYARNSFLVFKNDIDRKNRLQLLKERIKKVEEIETIYPEFDQDFYVLNNPHVLEKKICPVEHYCYEGWKDGFDPTPYFSTRDYLILNKDVCDLGINPFFHWLKFGQKEGRAIRAQVTKKTNFPFSEPGLFSKSKIFYPIYEVVDIIVPIFNAYDDVRECLEKLHCYTDPKHRVILINDGSTDCRIQPLCEDFFEKHKNTLLLNNIENKGFIFSVNRGFSEAKNHVVLLNTDAFVPDLWLERLMLPILRDPSIATVTPMTNNGEIANVPVICKAQSIMPGVAEKIDLIARCFDFDKTLIQIPTGVGFCMAISRDWLRKIPFFDMSFGRGYGEEVDWCQRIRTLGGKHMLTGALFVEHRGGMSFGPEKQARICENNQIISSRYENYDRDIHDFCAIDPAISVRLALGLALIGADLEVPVFLSHRLGGGAEIWLKDLIGNYLSNDRSAVVVRDGDTKDYVLLELHSINGVTTANVHLSDLNNYLSVIPKKEIIYSCLVGASNPIALAGLVIDNISASDRLRILFHDYFPVCPSYNLLDKQKKYCDLPEESTCEECYKCIKNDFGDLSPTVKSWRSQWALWLEKAEKIEVFSKSSKDIVQRVWPMLSNKITISPHVMYSLPLKIDCELNKDPIIGVLGSIGYQKGAKVLYDMAEKNDGRFKIIVIGDIDPAYSHPNIYVHGRFSRNEIKSLAVNYSINRWFLPSIWPETFSFVTRECLATGLPVFAFDIGAQAEVLKCNPGGRVLPLESTIDQIINSIIFE